MGTRIFFSFYQGEFYDLVKIIKNEIWIEKLDEKVNIPNY